MSDFDQAQDIIDDAPPTQPHSIPSFDRTAIRSHVEMLHRLAAQSGIDGVLVLACYGEDPATGRKSSSVERFSIGDIDSMVDAITAKEPIPHLNVYAPWHIMRHGLTGNACGTYGQFLRCPSISTATPARSARSH